MRRQSGAADCADKGEAAHLASVVHPVANEKAGGGVPGPGVQAFDRGLGFAGKNAGQDFHRTFGFKVVAGKGDGAAAVKNVVDQQDAPPLDWPRNVGADDDAAGTDPLVMVAFQPERVEAEVDAPPRQGPDEIGRKGRGAQQGDNAGPWAIPEAGRQTVRQRTDPSVNLRRSQQDVDFRRDECLSDGQPPWWRAQDRDPWREPLVPRPEPRCRGQPWCLLSQEPERPHGRARLRG